MNILGMINDDAKQGWISIPGIGRNIVLEKYCNVIQSIASSITFERPESEPLLKGDTTMKWIIK